MRSKASSPAIPESSGPAWIFPSPTGRTRSKSAAHFRTRWSFDVLHLFAQFFNLGADFERQRGDGERFAFHSRRLGEHRVRFAMHFLEQEIEFLAELAGAVEQFCKLLQVATQAIELFADVAALGEQRSFLSEPRRLDAAAAQQLFEAILQSPRECRSQTDRQFANLVGLLGNFRKARAQFLGKMAPFGVAHVVKLRERFAQTIFERGAELVLFFVRLWQRWREAADDTGKTQQRYDIEIGLHLHLLAQFLGSA